MPRMDALDPAGITIDPLPMQHREAHIWYAHVDRWEASADGLLDWLSPRERTRAAAYRFQADFLGYVVGHAMLRWLLARHLEKPHPRDVLLGVGRSGKPRLALRQALRGYRFSLSRSHSLAAVAITRRGRVGVDVEKQRGEGGLRPESLEREWVRRESVIKALGGTLDDLHRYDVRGDSPVTVRLHGFARRSVTVHDVSVDDGYEAAVALSPGWIPILAGEWTRRGPVRARHRRQFQR